MSEPTQAALVAPLKHELRVNHGLWWCPCGWVPSNPSAQSPEGEFVQHARQGERDV